MRVLAIDLGTAAVRVGLFEPGRRVLGIERRPIGDPSTGGPSADGRAEEGPATWWAAIADASRSLAGRHGGGVDAICAVGQGPTCVATDGDGEPTRPAITWRDRRDVPEADELAGASGVGGWDLGILPAAIWTIRHDPDAAAATSWFLGSWEWLAMRLSGVAATTAAPRPEVLAAASALGLDPDRIPPPVATGAVVGPLLPAAADELGLDQGAVVVAGTNDAAASVVGAGLREAGQSIDVGGSAGGFAVMIDEARGRGAYDPLPTLYGDRWLLGGAMAATGSALDWLVWNVLDGTVGRDALIAEAATVPPGADGLLFLPYLAGERAPIHDPAATGAFVGLTVGHGRAHLARAVLEAAAFAIRHVADPIVAAGIAVDEMRVVGGPARSESWNRIKADVTGFPVSVPVVREGALLGAAIVAQAAAIGGADLADLAIAEVGIDHPIEPDATLRATYDAAFDQYRRIDPRLGAELTVA